MSNDTNYTVTGTTTLTRTYTAEEVRSPRGAAAKFGAECGKDFNDVRVKGCRAGMNDPDRITRVLHWGKESGNPVMIGDDFNRETFEVEDAYESNGPLEDAVLPAGGAETDDRGAKPLSFVIDTENGTQTASLRMQIEAGDMPDIPAFGGYLAGSASEGTAKIVLNCDAIFRAVVAHPEAGNFTEFFTETFVHEMLHAFQELFGAAFDENIVNQLTDQFSQEEPLPDEAETLESLRLDRERLNWLQSKLRRYKGQTHISDVGDTIVFVKGENLRDSIDAARLSMEGEAR